ncbi:uncharacterized protein LOC133670431 isoform X2 [Populus nigra]|uniref:uncharacterized protein LOC133670431 isoform X2 n=1 Tax=Populus nigra TaxID=3691 RepID=UPI002B271CE5|nr:uncharacterized protein LOC133670431 isoform X2 [Populus nigra]
MWFFRAVRDWIIELECTKRITKKIAFIAAVEEELRLQRRGKRLCIGLGTLRDCLGLFLSPSFPSIVLLLCSLEDPLPLCVSAEGSLLGLEDHSWVAFPRISI